MLEGVLIDEAIEVLFQRAGDFGRSTGARAIQQALGPLVGKALDPFAQGRIGQVEGGGDGVRRVDLRRPHGRLGHGERHGPPWSA